MIAFLTDTYLEAVAAVQILLLVLQLCLMVFQIRAVISVCIRREFSKTLLICLPEILFTAGLFFFLMKAHRSAKGYETAEGLVLVMGNLPWLVPAAMILVLYMISLTVHRWLRKEYLETMTYDAIQEGLENLPMGICFYTLSGKPLLMNYKIDDLCRQITEKPLTNAKRFRRMLEYGDVPENLTLINSEKYITIKMPEGDVWRFEDCRITVGNRIVRQMTATDVTEVYQLGLQLNRSNRELEQMNERLRRHSENVERWIYEEETFAAKVSIHADMGQALLASRYYLEQKQEITEEFMEIWKTIIAVLRQEVRTEPKNNPLKQLMDAADAIGVKIQVKGVLPEHQMNVLNLLLAAARECLTNAVRHADADEMTMTISEKEDGYLASFTNNGKYIRGAVEEGGGLSGLRRQIEQAGGSMFVDNEREFRVTILIPKEGMLQ